MATCAPAPVDCQNLQFKQLCKLKTCADRSNNLYLNPTQLVATSSLRGLTFVGEQCGFKIIVSGKVFENPPSGLHAKSVIKKYIHRNIPLPSAPSHIDINSDQQFICVAFCKNETPFLHVYEIRSLLDSNPSVFCEVRLSSVNGTFVTDLSWNPAIPNMLTCCISDKTLSVYTFNPNGSFEIRSLPKESNSMCVCWSPKGKQLVVGNYNGFLTQYLPELKAVKNYPPPSSIFDKPCSLCSIKWLSNFQFIGVYKLQTPNDDDGDSKTSVIVINTSKNEPVSYINYEDICFSSGTERPCQFYFIHVAAWNMIFAASSNAVEVSVLKLNPDSISWCQWMLEDSARILMPLSNGNETYPVGIAIDYSSPIQTPIGEAFIPMPIMSVLTSEGFLCLYLINYFELTAPNICVKPSLEPQLQYFSNDDVTNEEDEVKPAIRTVPTSNMTTVSVSQTPDLSVKSNTFSVISTPTEVKNFESLVTSKANLPPLLGSSVNLANLSRLTNQVSPLVNVTSFSQNVSSSNSIVSSFTSIPEVTIVPTSVIDAPAVVPKNVLQAKVRLECLKKFKKIAASFESDILEIKELVENISIGNDCAVLPNKRLEKLEAEAKQLVKLKAELSSEVDSVKISIVEVFACIQDIKTKYFQLTNSGYRTLFGTKDMDPVNATNLKNIENKINYVESQLEKANKQLDEFWCKYTEQSSPSRMKIPVLDNIYETMLRQQKILKILELQTEKVQKRITAVKYQLKKNQWAQNKKDINAFANRSFDDITLAEFTQKALTVKDDYSDNEISNDAKTLARKFLLEHAKRFSISNAKQLKLQELHNSISVTYIQSSRLQRLKKKSLILLSKNAYSAESAREYNGDAAILATSHSIYENVEESRLQQVLPVSSDGVDVAEQVSILEYPSSLNIVSSTPVKSGDKFMVPRFAVEPSINVDVSLPLPPTTKTTTLVSVSKSASDPSSASTTIALPIQAKPKMTQPVTVSSFALLGAATTIASTSEATKPSFMASSSGKDITSFSFSNSFTTSASVSTSNTISKPLFSGEVTVSPVSVAGFNVTSAAGPHLNSSLFVNTLPSTVAPVSIPGSLFSGAALDSSSSSAPISSFFSNVSVSSTSTATASNASISLFSGSKQGTSGGNLFSSSTLANSNLPAANSTARVSPFSPLSDLTLSPASTMATFPQAIPISTALFGKNNISVSSASAISVSSGTSTMFGGTGSMFGKTGSSAASAINFGNMLPPANSLFNSKTQQGPTDLTAISNDKNTSAFSTFNFASKPVENTSVTVSEVPFVSTSSESADGDKENKVAFSVAAADVVVTTNAAAPATTFSFALINTVGFTPTKTNLFSTSEPLSTAITTSSFVLSTTTQPMMTVSPATATTESHASLSSILSSAPASPVSVASISVGNMFTNTPTTTKATVPTSVEIPTSVIATTLASSSTPATVITASVVEPVTPVPSPPPVISAPATPEANTTCAAKPTFENKGSFFEGLSLGEATTTLGASSSVFGKPAPGESTVFGESLFAQNITTKSVPAATISTSAGETKSIFGGSSVFGASNATNTESQSIFGAASSSSFPESQAPAFGSSSLFGNGSTFGSTSPNAASQANNTFNSSSGGMLFSGNASSGFSSLPSNSLFQGSAGGGFGSLGSFGSGVQQTQGTSGFGSPPSFPSVFNKASTFSSFGAAPTFGGSATFGGSPTKVFGQPAANQDTFGNSTGQQPTAFENMANDNSTMSFGNLAQQTPGFGSPPSFGGGNRQQSSFGQSNFGGTSFSSWR